MVDLYLPETKQAFVMQGTSQSQNREFDFMPLQTVQKPSSFVNPDTFKHKLMPLYFESAYVSPIDQWVLK
jgi:hypothetical protein